MFKNRSKVLFVATVLSILYVVYVFSSLASSASSATSDAEMVGTGLAAAILMPHIISMGLGAVFCALGFGLAKSWGALVGSILFCVGLVLMPLYFMFALPLIILGFIGYSKQKSIAKANKSE